MAAIWAKKPGHTPSDVTAGFRTGTGTYDIFRSTRFEPFKTIMNPTTGQTTDFLIIGSGIAGLCYAIAASRYGRVLMITKKRDSESNTNYAQGGIACVMDPLDSYESHINDTLVAGCGLCHEDAVRLLVEDGPERISELLEWGVQFSCDPHRPGTVLHLGKEGGHSINRIVHAKDLTGREVEETLLGKVKSIPSITLLEHHCAIDLITDYYLRYPSSKRNLCYGAYVLDTLSGAIYPVRSRITCLATGGAGRIYLHTTNPEIATGDGVAMAYRAGAKIANMEFMQFHPTTLFHEQADSFLISEALRGHGAILCRADGSTFMEEYHPLASLAPRDIVARAIDTEMKRSGDPCVFLDIRHSPAEQTIEHFPHIYHRCLSYGINITRDLIPVVPAAHYMCGGVLVDTFGASSIGNLYACGEVACTGVHGANRLASNSLLEALVFSRRAADAVGNRLQHLDAIVSTPVPPWDDHGTTATEEWILLSHNFLEIRSVMWDYVGIVRSNLRLKRALRRINLLEKEIDDFYHRTRVTAQLLDLRNTVLTAKLIIISALRRRESRGLHFTTDYPQPQDRHWMRDTIITRTNRS
ncbi:MAG: L-aspartate oxidase [Chitinispirillaceae bacterium]|nr:L-aspartate oxidase [Chitinispirillaceae bacterium]